MGPSGGLSQLSLIGFQPIVPTARSAPYQVVGAHQAQTEIVGLQTVGVEHLGGNVYAKAQTRDPSLFDPSTVKFGGTFQVGPHGMELGENPHMQAFLAQNPVKTVTGSTLVEQFPKNPAEAENFLERLRAGFDSNPFLAAYLRLAKDGMLTQAQLADGAKALRKLFYNRDLPEAHGAYLKLAELFEDELLISEMSNVAEMLNSYNKRIGAPETTGPRFRGNFVQRRLAAALKLLKARYDLNFIDYLFGQHLSNAPRQELFLREVLTHPVRSFSKIACVNISHHDERVVRLMCLAMENYGKLIGGFTCPDVVKTRAIVDRLLRSSEYQNQSIHDAAQGLLEIIHAYMEAPRKRDFSYTLKPDEHKRQRPAATTKPASIRKNELRAAFEAAPHQERFLRSIFQKNRTVATIVEAIQLYLEQLESGAFNPNDVDITAISVNQLIAKIDRRSLDKSLRGNVVLLLKQMRAYVAENRTMQKQSDAMLPAQPMKTISDAG